MAPSPKSTYHSRTTNMMVVQPDLLDRFHKPKVCDILPTNPTPQADMFAKFRPKPKTVLDYNISQTDLKMQRQIKFGIQKVHLTETRAEYVIPPPGYEFAPDPEPEIVPTPKIKYSTGGAPVWDFMDDIWRRKVDKYQKIYEEHLKNFIAERKRTDNEKRKSAHKRAIERVGPEWFQELSPKQLRAIDSLKNAIVKDVRYQTIENTQDVIAILGLVLRPNPHHIKIALKKCCECPVEFLLLLYQYMNNHRTRYSINDRLLLSGVVHLTMRETLKELHIRIPSPPPPPLRESKSSKQRNKAPQYESPYLIPFKFKPAPPKHKGIYKNRHKQYPESPYFGYVIELGQIEFNDDSKEDQAEESETKDVEKLLEGEAEIIAEMKTAQKIYNDLVTYRPIPRLRKPSIYIPCDRDIGKQENIGTELSETEEEIETAVKEEESESEGQYSSENEESLPVSVSVKLTTDYECCRPVKQTYEVSLEIGKPTSSKQEVEAAQTECAVDSEDTTEDSIESNNQEEELCKVASKDEETIEGVQDQAIDSTCQSTDDRVERKPSNTEQDIKKVEKRNSNECKCKEEVERKLENRLCQCDRCKAKRVADNLDGAPNCSCLSKYQERVRTYEDMKKRFDVQQNLMTLETKFILGGVTTSPNGEPVYMISGVEPKYDCSCALVYQKYLEEKRRLESMPEIPLGKQKYLISGVHDTGHGKVFVVSGAIPTEDCSCLKVFKEFQSRHSRCVEVYKDYLKKLQTDKQEYFQELGLSEESNASVKLEAKQLDEYGPAETSNIVSADSNMVDYNVKDATAAVIANQIEETYPSFNFDTEETEQPFPNGGNTIAPITSVKDTSAPSTEVNTVPVTSPSCDCATKAHTTLKEIDESCCCCGAIPTNCICEPEPEPLPICNCKGSDGVFCRCVEKVSEEGPPLRRFAIMEKIPCNYKEQREILKKILEVMAEDGFPLAKLPDCYKLPHFKLWMQLRCGKYWTMEDREALLLQSKIMWHHTNKCYTTPRIPKINHRAQYTWRDAKTVRRMVGAIDTAFYRKVRQDSINAEREFFPTTFNYVFPTPTFRDCYFAYTAAREGDVTCWKPWYPHEVKGARR